MKASLQLTSSRILYALERLPKRWVLLGAFLLLLVVAIADWLTPVELSLAVFHVVPVFLAAWLVGRRSGHVFAIAAAASWYLADALHPDAPAFKLDLLSIGTKLLFFGIIGELVFALRVARDLLRQEARTDTLTGLLNRRAFSERAVEELGRASRSKAPIVLAYIDVDDFKSVNDRFGHDMGDRVLIDLARTLTSHVRAGDLVARLGGDEFAVLLLDMEPEAAIAITSKLESVLSERLGALEPRVSFSIGLASWAGPPQGPDDLVREADARMYRAKFDRKAKGGGGAGNQ